MEDLKDQQYKDLFKTARTGDKAQLVSCIIGWACEEVNAAQVAGYGLSDHVEIVNPGDGAALNASLMSAYERREPWLGYQWGTNDPALQLDLVRLEEPAYSDECWFTTKACAYQDATILIAVNPALLTAARDVVNMLRAWDFNIDGVYKDIARWQAQNKVTNTQFTALCWLNSNSHIWSEWVKSDAEVNIKAALAAGELPDGWPSDGRPDSGPCPRPVAATPIPTAAPITATTTPTATPVPPSTELEERVGALEQALVIMMEILTSLVDRITALEGETPAPQPTATPTTIPTVTPTPRPGEPTPTPAPTSTPVPTATPIPPAELSPSAQKIDDAVKAYLQTEGIPATDTDIISACEHLRSTHWDFFNLPLSTPDKDYAVSTAIFLSTAGSHEIQMYCNEKHPAIKSVRSCIDFSENADLSGCDLRGKSFKEMDLRGANFEAANLIGTDFTRAILVGANFKDARMTNTKLDYAELTNADLSGADVRQAQMRHIVLDNATVAGTMFRSGKRTTDGSKFRSASLLYVNFDGMDLSGVGFIGADLSNSSFVNADLEEADLRNATLNFTDFSSANLESADLGKVNLTRIRLYNDTEFKSADLEGANLSGMTILNGNFESANFKDADLSGGTFDDGEFDEADFEGADLSDASFDGADLSEAKFRQAKVADTDFKDADLEDADRMHLAEDIDDADWDNTTCPDGVVSDRCYPNHLRPASTN